MTSHILQILFILGALCFFGLILIFLKKNTLSLKYTILWLLLDFVMLLVSAFPPILAFVARLLGFELPANAVFSLLLGFILVILLQLTSIASGQTDKIKALTQTVALLEKRVRELEGKDN